MTNEISEASLNPLDWNPTGSSTTQAQPLAELLPDPLTELCDPLAELEALLIQLKQQDRHSAREQHQAEERNIREAGEQRVAAMREQADELLTQAYWNAAGQIVGGAVTAGGAGMSLGGMDHEWAQLGEGAGGMLNGAGTLGAAFPASEANELTAQITELETEQSAAERRASQAQENMSAAADDLRTLLARIENIRNAEIAAQQAALFRI